MRILSLAPSNTEILYSLGLGDHIIGVTAYCDYPEEAKKKLKIGSWITTQPEKIKDLRPDLIFTSYFLPEPLRNWQGPGRVIHVEPKTLAEVFESIEHIGRSTNHITQARAVVKKMKTEFEQITSSYGNGVKRPLVYMEEWPAPPMASGNWVPELVKIAGGIPIVAQKGKSSQEFKLSDLIQSDPDIMIFHWCGFGTKFDKQMIRKREGWNKLRAVKNDHLFAIDDSLLNRPGPRLVQGAKQIQQIINKIPAYYG